MQRAYGNLDATLGACRDVDLCKREALSSSFRISNQKYHSRSYPAPLCAMNSSDWGKAATSSGSKSPVTCGQTTMSG